MSVRAKLIGMGLGLGVWALSADAVAQNVRIRLDPNTAQPVAVAAALTVPLLESLLEAEVRKAYSLVDVKGFLKEAANAQAFSGKGLGVDYVSDIELFVVGAAMNVSVFSGDQGFDELLNSDRITPVGAGVQVSAMAGVNLGFVDLDMLNVFVNGFGFSAPIDQLDGSFANVGLHLQWVILDEREIPALGWDGLRLTSGFEFTKTTLELSQPLGTLVPISEDGGTDAQLDSTGTFRLIQTGYTIPLELTTGISLLWVVSVYVGVALDVQLGNAFSEIGLNGTVTAVLENNEEIEMGTLEVTLDDENNANIVQLRGMLGLQLNLGPLRLFGQLNARDNTGIGVAAGARIAW